MTQLSTKAQIKVSVMIVNYNSGEYAKACIETVLKQQGLALEVLIVDNASQDNSVELLSRFIETNALANKTVKLIASPENLGFGRANNLAAKEATGDFLLFLNPDTLLESTDTLTIMVQVFGKNAMLGMLGPNIKEPRKAKVVLPRYKYPSTKNLKFTKKFDHLPGSIAWLLGACLLMPTQVFEQINGFDPDFFLYGEDADIGLRVRLAGYEIGYCSEVSIVHVSGASEIGADYLQKWLRKKRGLFLFCKKHFDSRDVNQLAKSTICKSKLYLTVANVVGFFKANNATHLEKKQRLKATIIAAQELLNDH